MVNCNGETVIMKLNQECWSWSAVANARI